METQQERATAAGHEPDRGGPLRCVACGYNLRGLPPSGRCPECGSPYTLDDSAMYVDRPMFGWLGMALAPVLLPIAWFVGVWTFFSGGWFLAGTPVLSLVLSVVIARRLAQWRYGVVLRSSERKDVFPGRVTYVRRMTVILSLLQIAACILTHFVYIAFVPWLAEMGFLPRGWS